MSEMPRKEDGDLIADLDKAFLGACMFIECARPNKKVYQGQSYMKTKAGNYYHLYCFDAKDRPKSVPWQPRGNWRKKKR